MALVLSFQSRLPSDTRKRTRLDIITGIAGNCNPPGLFQVLELTVASFLPDQFPAVCLHHSNRFSDLHRRASLQCFQR
jgi:hypothetical protein